MGNSLTRKGFGQVEPNHLSGIVTGQIYAQLPASVEMGSDDYEEGYLYLENGRFAKYDYAKHEVNLTGDGEWMLVYNEEQLYDERKQSHKDYAMLIAKFDAVKNDMVATDAYPRLIQTNVGDIFTTNLVEEDYSGDAPTYVTISDNGYLQFATAKGDGMAFVVVDKKFTTMPDRQPAVKLQRIQ